MDGQAIHVSIVTETTMLADVLAHLVSGFGRFRAAPLAPTMLDQIDQGILLIDEGSARLLGGRARAATVVVLATRGHDEADRIAAGVGAAGCIDMDITPGQLRRALEQAHGNGRIEGRPVQPGRGDGGISLSPREHQVLRGLAAGKKGIEIGRDLGVSPHTVRTHIQNLMGKLGVSSRLEAVIAARKLGLLEDDRRGGQQRGGS